MPNVQHRWRRLAGITFAGAFAAVLGACSYPAPDPGEQSGLAEAWEVCAQIVSSLNKSTGYQLELTVAGDGNGRTGNAIIQCSAADSGPEEATTAPVIYGWEVLPSGEVIQVNGPTLPTPSPIPTS